MDHRCIPANFRMVYMFYCLMLHNTNVNVNIFAAAANLINLLIYEKKAYAFFWKYIKVSNGRQKLCMRYALQINLSKTISIMCHTSLIRNIFDSQKWSIGCFH